MGVESGFKQAMWLILIGLIVFAIFGAAELINRNNSEMIALSLTVGLLVVFTIMIIWKFIVKKKVES